MPKKVLIAVPPLMLEKIDYIAVDEHRTRSDLFREALRRYIEGFEEKKASKVPVSYDIDRLIEEGR